MRALALCGAFSVVLTGVELTFHNLMPVWMGAILFALVLISAVAMLYIITRRK